jgi:aryl-alcohol dehydrogenase-like predicted oxidoreductase
MNPNVTSRPKLGAGGPMVSPIGLGCMGMSEFYDPSLMDHTESIRVIHRYLDGSGNFLDTADVYGVDRNELLVGKATFVAYSPLGRGFLRGAIQKPEDLAADDWRRNSPRFQGENFQKNLELAQRIRALAGAKGCTPNQLALGWVFARYSWGRA